MKSMITSKDDSFFRMAKNASTLSDEPRKRHRVGCVVVDKKRVISSGYSSMKTSPLQKKYNRERFTADTPHTLHAETHALKHFVNNHTVDMSKVSVYIYRELSDGSTGMARPCPSCMKLIRDLGIKHIYYTTPDGYAEEKLVY